MILSAKRKGLGTFVSEYGTTTLTDHAPIEYDMVKYWLDMSLYNIPKVFSNNTSYD